MKPPNSPNENGQHKRGHGHTNREGSVTTFADSMYTSEATFPSEVDLTNGEQLMLLKYDTTSLVTTEATSATSPTANGTGDTVSTQ